MKIDKNIKEDKLHDLSKRMVKNSEPPVPESLRVNKVFFFNETMVIDLNGEGLSLITTINNWPELKKASEKQRENYELLGDGLVISWPDLYFDVRIIDLLKNTTTTKLKKNNFLISPQKVELPKFITK